MGAEGGQEKEEPAREKDIASRSRPVDLMKDRGSGAPAREGSTGQEQDKPQPGRTPPGKGMAILFGIYLFLVYTVFPDLPLSSKKHNPSWVFFFPVYHDQFF